MTRWVNREPVLGEKNRTTTPGV